MSVFTDLPEASRLSLDYRQPTQISASGLLGGVPATDCTETWTEVQDAEIVAFLNVLFGTPQTFGTILGGVTRIVPMQHWRFPGLYCDDFRATAYGVGDASALDPAGGLAGYLPGRYRAWRVSAHFKTPQYPTSGDKAYLAESFSPSVRTVQLPASGARVGGVPTVYDPGRTVHGQTLTLTSHQVPSFHPDLYRAFTGYSNATEFLGYPQGTVKYLGPAGESSSSFDGTTSYTIGHTFDLSDLPWNYAARPDGTFALKTYSDGTLEFPYADFSALFS